jgi:hypothetical protein
MIDLAKLANLLAPLIELLRPTKTTRQLAAARQIAGAVQHFRAGELECAVTLALAAEEQLPHVDAPYLLAQLRAQVPAGETVRFNELRNWLKHYIQPDEIEMTKIEVRAGSGNLHKTLSGVSA